MPCFTVLSNGKQWHLYVRLTSGADDIRERGEYVPNLRRWNFDLAEHFFQLGRRDLAIRLGELLQSRNPKFTPLRVRLAQLYREAGDPGRAIALLKIAGHSVRDLGVLLEWGRAESAIMARRSHAVLLIGASLAGSSPEPLFRAKHAAAALGALATTFELLYEDYLDSDFRTASLAAAQLCSLFPFKSSRAHAKRFLKQLPEESLDSIDVDGVVRDMLTGFQRVRQFYVNQDSREANVVLQDRAFVFDHLRRLLANAAARKEATSGDGRSGSAASPPSNNVTLAE
jgi:hypothetical protein